MKVIDRKLLDETTAKAKTAPRKRMNCNFHEHLEDPLHRLINAMEPETYLRPHRHLNPDRDEFFLILRGKVVIFIFDDDGNIVRQTLLDPQAGVYGGEIKAGVWHGLLVLESGSVIYEVKQGPYVPLSAGNFAPWSPDPEDRTGVREFLSMLGHSCSHQG
ncbi:MAG: WbuC family cupin fold metalloprotein [Prevotellaceae bacterium]|jgi:cupin fold WbuC family metalloprotein|nr:WbuC family cupin fold metalloprotein [Prevotellaceae bacterium]